MIATAATDRQVTQDLSSRLDADEEPSETGRRVIVLTAAEITTIGDRWIRCVWDLLHHGWGRVRIVEGAGRTEVWAWPTLT